jgi:hypothetical protein
MQIWIDVLGVEFRILQHSNDLFQISCCPPVGNTINDSMYLVCTLYVLVHMWYVLVHSRYVLDMYWYVLVHAMYVLQSNQSVPVFLGKLVQEKFRWCNKLV